MEAAADRETPSKRVSLRAGACLPSGFAAWPVPLASLSSMHEQPKKLSSLDAQYAGSHPSKNAMQAHKTKKAQNRYRPKMHIAQNFEIPMLRVLELEVIRNYYMS